MMEIFDGSGCFNVTSLTDIDFAGGGGGKDFSTCFFSFKIGSMLVGIFSTEMAGFVLVEVGC